MSIRKNPTPLEIVKAIQDIENQLLNIPSSIPTTSTAGKVLTSTSTAGTVTWADPPSGGSGTYTEIDASTGTTFTLSPGNYYDFGQRGKNSEEELTLTFTSANNTVGEFILSIAAINYPITLHTNLDSMMMFIEPLETGVSYNRTTHDITLNSMMAYQISIFGNFANGLFVCLKALDPISNVIIDKDGKITFNTQYGVTAYKLDNTTLSQNQDISSIITSDASQHTFTLESDVFPSWTGQYYLKKETGTVQNLILSGTTLTWDVYDTNYSYIVTSSDNKSQVVSTNSINLNSTFTQGTTIYVAPRFGISTTASSSVSSNIGYCVGNTASIEYTSA